MSNPNKDESDHCKPMGRKELIRYLEQIIKSGLAIRRETLRPDNLSASVEAIAELNEMHGYYHDSEPSVFPDHAVCEKSEAIIRSSDTELMPPPIVFPKPDETRCM